MRGGAQEAVIPSEQPSGPTVSISFEVTFYRSSHPIFDAFQITTTLDLLYGIRNNYDNKHTLNNSGRCSSRSTEKWATNEGRLLQYFVTPCSTSNRHCFSSQLDASNNPIHDCSRARDSYIGTDMRISFSLLQVVLVGNVKDLGEWSLEKGRRPDTFPIQFKKAMLRFRQVVLNFFLTADLDQKS